MQQAKGAATRRTRPEHDPHVVLCLPGLQQDWGKDTPITRLQVYRVVCELLRSLEAEQLRNHRAIRSHAKRHAVLRASPETLP